MPTLTERLKMLGVVVGAQNLPPPQPALRHPIEDILPGRLLERSGSTTFIATEVYAPDYLHGRVGLHLRDTLQTIADWAGEPDIVSYAPEEYCFLDTETSGLAGGTGTFAFLIGAGRITSAGFELSQFFMRDPLDEPALLLALEEFIAPCKALVSFNGKSFDIPLLTTRYTLQGWPSPFRGMAHIDLLHLSRRLWRDRLPSRTLSNLEVQILGAQRTEEEVPGWMIPQMYFEYLRSGDARPIKSVFYHNSVDVVSMAALLNFIAGMLADPQAAIQGEVTDQAAVARLLDELGHTGQAALLYQHCLEHSLPEALHQDTLQRLASLFKRQGDYPSAIPLWEQAALDRRLYAYEELAKYYEHHAANLTQATRWSKAALKLLARKGCPPNERMEWQPAFQHRLERLLRKQGLSESTGE